MKNYDEQRKRLKEAGFNRCDRKNEELWLPPWNGIGFSPIPISFRAAMKRLESRNEMDSAKE